MVNLTEATFLLVIRGEGFPVRPQNVPSERPDAVLAEKVIQHDR